MASGTGSGAACPLPPAGLSEAVLPVFELNLAGTELLRIHRRIHDPIFYNRRALSPVAYRFDAPDDSYGVLYASPSFEACMAETLMRGRYQGEDLHVPHVVAEREITERCVAVLGFDEARPLRLADLTQPLWQVGFDTRVLSVADYSVPNLWSQAIHKNIARLDGIYFVSRYANAPSVAIFHDRALLKARGGSTPLLAHPALPDFLDRFGIAIADGSGDDWRGAV